MRPRFLTAVVLAAVIAGATACGSSPTSPQSTTETLTGTLSVGNANFYQFNASAGGDVSLQLVSLAPVVAGIGVGLGVVSGGSCYVQASTTLAVGGSWITSVSDAGTYCVSISDVGALTQDTAYSVTLIYP